MRERLFTTLAAPEGHALTHRPQPMQLTSHCFRASLPGASLEQATTLGKIR